MFHKEQRAVSFSFAFLRTKLKPNLKAFYKQTMIGLMLINLHYKRKGIKNVSEQDMHVFVLIP